MAVNRVMLPWSPCYRYNFGDFSISIREGAFVDGNEVAEFWEFMALGFDKHFGYLYSPTKFSFRSAYRDFMSRWRFLLRKIKKSS